MKDIESIEHYIMLQKQTMKQLKKLDRENKKQIEKTNKLLNLFKR